MDGADAEFERKAHDAAGQKLPGRLKWGERAAEAAGMKRTHALRSLAPVLVLVSAFLGGAPVATRAEESPGAASTTTPAGVQVARAVFARAIVDREPQDVVSGIDGTSEQLYFFTEILGMQGQTVRHRWEYAGQVMAEVEFKVSAQRWRIFSSKRFLPGQTGPWTVSVIDETGRVLRSETLGHAYASAPETSVPAAPDEP